MNRRESLNRNLLIAAVALFALSAFSYYQSVQRAERFERGQKFLSNLNPDEIAQIQIKKGDEETVLKRSGGGDRFLIPSENGYRAQNSSVNRLIKDVLGLSLEKEVGSGESLEKELELVAGPDNKESIEVALLNDADKEMVRFVIGKGFDGGGNYVLRLDDPERTVYLTDKRVYLSTSGADFLDKQIVDIPEDEIQSIRGRDFAVARGGVLEGPEPEIPESQAVVEDSEGIEGEDAEAPTEPEAVAELDLELVDLPQGKKASSKLSQIKRVASGLRFTQHHLANAPEVAGLVFSDGVEVELKNGTTYVIEVATKADKSYLRLEGFHKAAVRGGVTIARDASDEEVKETSEVLEAIDKLQTFNAFHGSWIYEVTDSVAEKVRYTASDLTEDA